MTYEEWPPPPSADPGWREIRLGLGADPDIVRVRPVRLWGRDVLIDWAGDVVCDGCAKLVPVAELGKRTNQHSVGLPFSAAGQFVPAPLSPPDAASDEDEAPPWPSW